MKNLFTFLIALALLGLSAGAVNAQTTWYIGTPNATDVTATLDLDSTMTISGTGAMQNFAYGAAPWYSVRSSITALVIQSGVTNISDGAFYNCSGLTGNLTIPNSVTSIGKGAFESCSGLTGLTIGNSVRSIGDYAFFRCSLTGNLTIPNSVTSIGGSAFESCSGLTGLTIGNSVTSIGEYAFDSCRGLTGSLTIPNSVTFIGLFAFQYCFSFTSLNYNASNCTSCISDAFSVCHLTALNIGNNVQTIPDYAFVNFPYLTSVTNNRAAPQVINANVFADATYANATLYVPSASYTAYLLANGWNKFNHIQQIGVAPTVTTASLPNGTVGTAYSQTLQATGDTPITWSFTGNLPNGLSLDGTTGMISGTPTASGTFNFTVTATNGAGSASKALSVVIDNAAPVLTYSISASTPVSFGSLQAPYTQPVAQTITVTNTGTGSVTLNQPAAAYYLIGAISPTILAAGAKATFTVQPKANLPAGNYDETITVSGSAGVSVMVSASFAVTAPPVVNAATPTISSQPQSVTVKVGEVALLSVTASVSDGGALSYQWLDAITGTAISGATGRSYSPPTTTAGTYYYYVMVTNTNTGATGNTIATMMSDVATVTVNALFDAEMPIIINHPQDTTVKVGDAVTLSVTASVSDGGSLSYQWYNNYTAKAISGATGRSYSPPTTIAGTYYYYVMVTNTNNSATGKKTATMTSYVATVTVKNATGIENISQATGLKAWVVNGTLHVSGLTAGKLWSVYNVTGRLIYQGIASGDEATLSIPTRGVYIVQSENKRVKILSEP